MINSLYASLLVNWEHREREALGSHTNAFGRVLETAAIMNAIEWDSEVACQIKCNWDIFAVSCNASADVIIVIHVCTGPKGRSDVAERAAQEYSWRRKAQICVTQLFGQPIITERFHCDVSQIVWYYKNGNPLLRLPWNTNRTERWFEEHRIKNRRAFFRRYSLKWTLFHFCVKTLKMH